MVKAQETIPIQLSIPVEDFDNLLINGVELSITY